MRVILDGTLNTHNDVVFLLNEYSKKKIIDIIKRFETVKADVFIDSENQKHIPIKEWHENGRDWILMFSGELYMRHPDFPNKLILERKKYYEID